MPHRFFKPKHKKRSHAASLAALLVSNLFVLSVLLLSQLPVNKSGTKILGFATNVTLVDLFDQTNVERENLGLKKLKYSPVLEEAAKNKALDMFTDNYWAHVAPDGKTPWDFIEESGYKYLYAGENLAKDFDKTPNLIKAWMNSPTHKENIVNPNYTEIGFAVVNGKIDGQETTLVVQEFAKPEPGFISTSLDSPLTDVGINAVTTEGAMGINSVNPVNKTFVTINVSYILYFAYFVLGFFATSLFIDGIWAYKQRHLRITGNTHSHIILFAAAIIFVFYLHRPGII